MNKSKLWLKITTALSALTCLGLFIGTFVVLEFAKGLPDADGIREIELKVPLRVFSSDGLLISEFGNERRIPIDFEDTPQALINAVLASEDDNFFNHLGIDLFGLVRAALANFSSGRSGQGASTITMQVARNFYLTPEKTYTRKIKEILLAIRLEQVLDKEEILSLYLNKIFLGHRAYGFGAASEVYYGTTLDQLSLAQIAMLAGLPKAPSSYNPLRNPERATIRRNYVLKRMKSLEWITESAYSDAVDAPVTAEKHARETGLNAPHIAEMVRSQLTEQYGEGAYWQGLNVYTTVESDKQVAATKALRSGLRAYDRRHGFRGPVGHIDLSELEITNENASELYEDALREFPGSQEQSPALILGFSNENDSFLARIWSRDSGFTSIDLKEAKWAKKHINANKVGPPVTAWDDLFKVGDIAYVAPAEDKDASTSEQKEPNRWVLSQIPDVSGSIISLDPSTGRIISLVGGYDFFLNKYNRATQSIRQPGSNIKPFIYSASLEKGFSPASLISGAPIVLTDPTHGTRWRPENYSGKFFGPTRMRVALSKSMNLVSIRLLRAIGIPFARDYVSRFGIDLSRFSSTLTMALGSGGVKPIEMISSYAVLANGGYKISPYFIERITDRSGAVIFEAPQPTYCDECILDYLPKPEIEQPEVEPDFALDVDEPSNQDQSLITLEVSEQKESLDIDANTYPAPRVMTHANNFMIVSMLKDVVKRGTARKALSLNRPDIAGKTGTTNDYVDAWFSGFTSNVVTTVWVGFDQPSSMGKGEAGSLAALPIWIDYMKVGLNGVEVDRDVIPPYIETGFVDRNNGQRTDESNPSATAEYFTIENLTPEYTLMENFVDSMLGDTSRSLEISDEGADVIGEMLDQDSDFEELDDALILDDPTLPEERIIESEEDTDGLF